MRAEPASPWQPLVGAGKPTPRELQQAGFCLGCGGRHRPDPLEAYVDFKGHRFTAPFFCLCCGLQICLRQFCFGRACGVCDTGACERGNRAFRPEALHPRYCRMEDGELVIPNLSETVQ